MNILLVGATGFVGRHLLLALQQAGHQVVATCREPRSQNWPGVEWRPLDLNLLAVDPEGFDFPESVDLLINAAGLLSVDAAELSRVQDRGTCALFDLAAQRGVRVLQVSALGASAQSDVPFLASKGAADDYLLGLGIEAVVLRPSLVVGEGGASSAWLAALSPWPLIPLLDLKAHLQPVHIADVVGAVLALLRRWPVEAMVLPLVGPEPMRLGQVIDHLRAVQGWAPGRYVQAPLLGLSGRVGDRLGWRALNRQSITLAQQDNVADPEVLASVCGYSAAPLSSRLQGWPTAAVSSQLTIRPLMLAVLVLIWLGTAAVCLGPGYEWGLRIMAQAGVHGVWAMLAVIGGSLCDGLLGIGLLIRRWRRHTLLLQLLLMAGYTVVISFVLPHYWFDPYAAVAKNLVLMVATLWLFWTEPTVNECRR
ncbi:MULTISPECIES: SDR family oxidoreductase [unclassified Pseudomonas]|uniref:SDR family oxidoreductase n=1 Tax=unclassified Pseudomonas TaxID=196821 RepID=UPI000F56D5AB|nr:MULTISPECIES: SDR family oxidoreductase [unclassified Pseudomonas]AZF50225.1 putative nucleoside-diphosphate-sugar epimerase [Pseudomonas sp. R2-7-07]AZF60733.1 putative nucleoside-diphosphate-sugar epimerase [Pseudomonas sp. R11-23-07]